MGDMSNFKFPFPFPNMPHYKDQFSGKVQDLEGNEYQIRSVNGHEYDVIKDGETIQRGYLSRKKAVKAIQNGDIHL